MSNVIRSQIPLPNKDAIPLLDLFWLVGLLEGEGYFGMTPKSRTQSNNTAKLALKMTDEDVVSRVASIFQAPVKLACEARPNRKQCYVITLNGAPALAWMHLLMPYMGQRRRTKIENIISMC